MTPLWKRDLLHWRPVLIVIGIVALTMWGCMVHDCYG